MTREFCEELVGSTVCAGYPLHRLIAYTGRGAVYLTTSGEESAALKLVPAQFETTGVPHLESDHILRLFASGACEIAGSPFHYFVTELADENLAAVIVSRPLTSDEALAMLKSVLPALDYLHGRGLAHGSIKPSNILATGDSIKLSADSIRPAGAQVSRKEVSREADMRDLGLTVIEVLTQRRDPSAAANLSQPFLDIVEHTLQSDPASRWTARQAAMRLSGATLPPAEPPAESPAESETSPTVPARLIPGWFLPTAVAVMICAVAFILARGSGSSSGSSLAAGNPPPVPQVSPAPHVPPKPTPFDPSPKPVAAPAPPEGRGWFVVVASYSRDVDAAQEAAVLSHRFPQFKPQVFPPSAIDTHYLVIIGSGLTEEDAESLRQRAVSTGLPPDTYIKRYPKPM